MKNFSTLKIIIISFILIIGKNLQNKGSVSLNNLGTQQRIDRFYTKLYIKYRSNNR